jgi:predicted ester cyclase
VKSGRKEYLVSARYNSAEDNKIVAERFFKNLSSQGEIDTADEFIAPDYVGHMPPYPDVQGPEGYREFAARTFTTYRDVQYPVEDMLATEEDKVVTRWTFLGTYQAQYELDRAFDGQPLTMSAISILHIVNGKVAESWTNFDFLSAMQRWGPLPEVLGLTEPTKQVRVLVENTLMESSEATSVFLGDTEITWPLIPPAVTFRWPPRW